MRAPVTNNDLKITLNHDEKGDLLCLNGRLNIDSSPVLRSRLLAMLHVPSTRSVMVDFAEVSYIDVSGLATLLEGLKVARKRGASLCLKGLQGRPLQLFEVTGLLALFETSGCANAVKVS